MTKLQVLDLNGNKKSEITTSIFDSPIRVDIVQKIVESEKVKQPYSPFLYAGMQTSASGNVKHNRHVWKTDRGKGLSRYPKKRMSDKGERFVWVAAAIPGVRGGRRAHSPVGIYRELKINKKEQLMGLLSALAMVASEEQIKKKYSTLNNIQLKVKLPIIVDVKSLGVKSGEFFDSLNKMLGEETYNIAIQGAKVRAGRGKMRNRFYKKNAGLLLVIGNKEEKKISGIDVKKAGDIQLIDLAVNGARLVMFTEQAIRDFEGRINGKGEEKKIDNSKNKPTRRRSHWQRL
jgi:large subunit ribosomal protein L4e